MASLCPPAGSAARPAMLTAATCSMSVISFDLSSTRMETWGFRERYWNLRVERGVEKRRSRRSSETENATRDVWGFPASWVASTEKYCFWKRSFKRDLNSGIFCISNVLFRLAARGAAVSLGGFIPSAFSQYI